MENAWTLRVRILGEDLVLFKDRSGRLGLIEESCPHRRASLANGIPTEDGIRCPYHGWMFDGAGRCIEQPFETERHALNGKKATNAYPVQELGGIVFAYLGTTPAPLLPRFGAFVWDRAIRSVGRGVIDCNWLQCMENTADPVHTEWLHGALHEFRNEKTGTKTKIAQKHARIAFDDFEFGLIKRRLYEGQSETAQDWTIGHPLVFPNILLTGSDGGIWKAHNYQIRVPIDDTHTMQFWYHAYVPPEGVETPPHLFSQTPPFYEPCFVDAKGRFDLDLIDAQDIMAWVTQGAIADRTRENLGASDRGVVEYRRMLRRELDKIERGEDPIGIIRDPARNTVIDLPIERGKDMYSDGFASFLRRQTVIQSPIADDLIRLFTPKNTAAPNAPEPVPAK
jgi:5,5'-dehydrodivanillate O-demethylase